ncbi:MAG: nickel-binding protein [Candidatus Hodarchaeota archaeon]
MPKYFVIHPFSKRAIEAMVKLPPDKNKMLKDLKANCNADADWIRSWAVPEQEKFYCEWNAKSPEAIRELFDKLGGTVIEAIYQMEVIDAEDFK